MIETETSGLAAERQRRIREILKLRGVVRVDELREALAVSAATVRRDLADLDLRGQLRRVHGGAVSLEGRMDEPVFDDKAAIAAREKQCIAEAALRFVNPSDCIFLDGGSTVLALARLLGDMKKLTVVTNSLRVASTLAPGGPNMILVGGEFRRLSQTFVGSLTRPLLEQLHVDTAFMGTIGLSTGQGMTTTDPREAQTKEWVLAKAGRRVLLCDSSKIGKVSFVSFGQIADIDILVTDNGIRRPDRRAFRKCGVEVVT